MDKQRESATDASGTRCFSQDWIEKLIRFETVSSQSNLGLIEAVRDHFGGLGLQPILTFDKDSRKANLFCSVPDVRGNITGGVVLSGHTDVVPVAGQEWDTDPFVPCVRGGKLYGRGSADMKGFIGAVLAHVPAMQQAALSIPLHVALSFDEEVGCLGAPLMLREIETRGIKPQGCIVGEPTLMSPVISHKGFSAHRCRIHGRAAHSSIPAEGVNAIDYAGAIIRFIHNLADEMRRDGPFDADFNVPYSTVQTSSVRGGGTLNTIPDLCELDFMIRNLPDSDVDAILGKLQQHIMASLLPSMQAEAGGADFVDISIEKIASAPGLTGDEGSQVARWIRTLRQDDTMRKIAYGSEAGLFQRAGIPSIVCGPGNIIQAHRPNEFIELQEIVKCEDMLGAFIQMISVN